jgi:hypothetical protein
VISTLLPHPSIRQLLPTTQGAEIIKKAIISDGFFSVANLLGGMLKPLPILKSYKTQLTLTHSVQINY